MKKRRRTIYAVIGLSVVSLLCVVRVSFYPPLGRQSDSVRIATTRASLALIRHEIEVFREHSGRDPNSLAELVAASKDEDGELTAGLPYEFVANDRGNCSEHASLNGEGGWYYDKTTGNVKINLDQPLKHYLPSYHSQSADQVPSQWWGK